MTNATLEKAVEQAWDDRESIGPATKGAARDAIEAALEALDSGTLRVAEKGDAGWTVNQWLKKAVLLSFRIYDMVPLPGGPSFPGIGDSPWFDKVPSKFAGWDDAKFRTAGFHAVPNCTVRRSAAARSPRA